MKGVRVTIPVLLGLALSSCTIGIQTRPYNVTIDNSHCLSPATVFIDGQNVGRVPGGGVRSFPVATGRHSLNVDNDISGPQIVSVNNDITWRGGLCL